MIKPISYYKLVVLSNELKEKHKIKAGATVPRYDCIEYIGDYEGIKPYMNYKGMLYLNLFNAQDIIKANEKRMVEIGALQTHINNYSRTRSVYEAYRKSGYSIKFFEEHREEIQIHKAAKKAFDQLPGKKVPTRQSLNEEYHRLLSGKKEAYAEYRQVKKDMQEYLIAKQTVEHILGIDRKNRIITQQQNLD